MTRKDEVIKAILSVQPFGVDEVLSIADRMEEIGNGDAKHMRSLAVLLPRIETHRQSILPLEGKYPVTHLTIDTINLWIWENCYRDHYYGSDYDSQFYYWNTGEYREMVTTINRIGRMRVEKNPDCFLFLKVISRFFGDMQVFHFQCEHLTFALKTEIYLREKPIELKAKKLVVQLRVPEELIR